MESYENFVISAVSYAWNLRPQKQVSEDRSPHDTIIQQQLTEIHTINGFQQAVDVLQ